MTAAAGPYLDVAGAHRAGPDPRTMTAVRRDAVHAVHRSYAGGDRTVLGAAATLAGSFGGLGVMAGSDLLGTGRTLGGVALAVAGVAVLLVACWVGWIVAATGSRHMVALRRWHRLVPQQPVLAPAQVLTPALAVRGVGAVLGLATAVVLLMLATARSGSAGVVLGAVLAAAVLAAGGVAAMSGIVRVLLDTRGAPVPQAQAAYGPPPQAQAAYGPPPQAQAAYGPPPQ
ncbi:MAG: hypothetical protein JJE50_12370, partial [Actinomycetales bacterium]|nr:hypothetical protein [Actinomycetales bacterium]